MEGSHAHYPRLSNNNWFDFLIISVDGCELVEHKHVAKDYEKMTRLIKKTFSMK